MLRAGLVFLLLLTLIPSGCGPRQVRPRPEQPPKPRVEQKQKPPSGTQRPYRVLGKTYYPISSAHGYRAKGLASWYGRRFHGRKTASGERYDMYAMTAAHKTLPLGTQVEVWNLNNNRKTRVRINDRGPFVKGRIIDLSYKAAKKLGVIRPGTAPVLVTAVGQAAGKGRAEPPPAFEMGPFTIQVGSFSLRTNAERLAEHLSRRYAPEKARVTVFNDSKTIYYRVRIFEFKTEDEARLMVQRMSREGYGTGMVVAKD